MPKVDLLLSPEAALFPGPLVERRDKAPEWCEGEEEGSDLVSAGVESDEGGGPRRSLSGQVFGRVWWESAPGQSH